jgi:ribosomal protein S12 methylthiotransferase
MEDSMVDIAGKRVYVENLGCAKNQVDAEVMVNELVEAGCSVVDMAEDADIILVNTCGFIESAREESVNTFFALRQQYPEAKVIMTGCLSQRYGKELEQELVEADGIFGNRDLSHITTLVRRVYAGERAIDLPAYPPITEESDKRGKLFNFPGTAYLKISEGCNHRCRYCAIPVIRGPLRSRSFDAVVEEARRLVATGIVELNLIAQDLAAFGTDDGSGSSHFIELLQALVAIEGDFRIRMLYIHPDAFPSELPEFVKDNPKVLPYFDIPFQHAHPDVLRPMGRLGDRETYLKLVESIRATLPNATLRSTFMLGFTDESADTIAELKRFVSEAQLDWVGSFTYSREEGTPAYKDRTEAEHKAMGKKAAKWQKELEAIQEPITTNRLQRFVGTTQPVLIEELVEGEDLAIGRTPHQAPEVDGLTVVMGRNLVVGTIVECGIARVNGIDLEAIPVKREVVL